MAITHSTAVRNAATDAVVDLIDAGTTNPQGTLQIAQDAGFTTILATIDLANPAFGAASGGTATAAGLPVSDSAADATGTAAYWRVLDRDNGQVLSGTATATGGGGDLELVSTALTAGEPVEITGFNYTALPV